MNAPPAFKELLAGMADPSMIPEGAAAGLALDSRRVGGGELFLAYPGSRQDGRSFIGHALQRGAVAVAFDPERFEYTGKAPGIPVPGLAARVSEIAARFHGRPTERLFVIGVTGTNGKTSCVHFLAQSLERLGLGARMIGTLGSGEVRRPQATELTTPDALVLQKLMREFIEAGATHVVMEVSSHALKQGRVSAVQFDAAVFTNLSRDHLDYHADIRDYAAAKKSLFSRPSLRFAVVNGDDPVGREIAGETEAPVVTVGEGSDCDVRADALRVDESGLAMTIRAPRGRLILSVPLVGRINVANVLAVAAVLLELEIEPSEVERVLNALSPVPGRMELFRSPNAGPTAVVDYAHTPDALARALKSVREHCRGELWCVFGCGGDRDRGKRPEMGRIAEQWADHVVVTNDNPRGEQPDAIAAEIVAGMSGEPRVVLDRRRAIAAAVESAGAGDWVLIAGKGHETYQIIGNEMNDFDDREVVSGCLGKAA